MTFITVQQDPPQYARASPQCARITPASGTFATIPSNINDNNVATNAISNAPGETCIFELPSPMHVRAWRQYGNVGNTGDGTFRLEYLTSTGGWATWQVSCNVSSLAAWSGWSNPPAIITSQIRLVTLIMDSSGFNRFGELELDY